MSSRSPILFPELEAVQPGASRPKLSKSSSLADLKKPGSFLKGGWLKKMRSKGDLEFDFGCAGERQEEVEEVEYLSAEEDFAVSALCSVTSQTLNKHSCTI